MADILNQIVEVKRQGAQEGGGNLGANTEVTTVHGSVEVGPLADRASTTMVNAFQSLGIAGSNLGRIGNLTQQQMTIVLADFANLPRRGFNQDTSAALIGKEQTKVAAAETSVLPLPTSPQLRQANNPGGCGGAPCVTPQPRPTPPPPRTPGS